MNLKSYKTEMYCTPLDVRLISAEVFKELDANDRNNLTDQRLETYIIRACGIVDSYLSKVMSPSEYIVDAYVSPPVAPIVDEDGEGENQGDIALAGIIVGEDATTEQWKTLFTSTTAFTLTGSYSGSQGTGATTTAFTATDLDISIPSALWSGTAEINDSFKFSTYKHHKSIVTATAMITAGLVFTGQFEGTDTSSKLYKEGIELLKRIVDNNGDLEGSNSTSNFNTKDINVFYEISSDGVDVTNYEDDEYERYKYSSFGDTFNG